MVISLLVTIGGANLLSDGPTTVGLIVPATAVVVNGIRVATWRWAQGTRSIESEVASQAAILGIFRLSNLA